MASSEDTFARLVSLAVHDLRTPLATVSGFARTLARTDPDEPTSRYLEFMVAASDQLAELLEELGLAARIEGGRWEPNVQSVGTRALVDRAAAGLEADVSGDGADVRVDEAAATTAVHQLARCALRHGGLERIALRADGPVVEISPIVESAVPVLLREEARDLGALIAARIIPASGGELELEGDRLLIRLPAA